VKLLPYPSRPRCRHSSALAAAPRGEALDDDGKCSQHHEPGANGRFHLKMVSAAAAATSSKRAHPAFLQTRLQPVATSASQHLSEIQSSCDKARATKLVRQSSCDKARVTYKACVTYKARATSSERDNINLKMKA
jgi:hypothetical protein